MALGSSIANALPPTIDKLREQLAGLSSKAARDVPAAAEEARSSLMQQVMDYAPLLMELGSALLRRFRGTEGAVAERLAPVAAPPRRRSRVLRPIVIGMAVFGAAYLVSLAMRPGAASGRSAQRR